MYRTKRRILKSLVLGFAVAAFAAPTALAEPRGPGNSQNHSDFWNYSATGEQIADTSPGVAAADLERIYNASVPSLGSDDRSVYRGTSPQLDPTLVSSPDDRTLYRGVERPDVVGSDLSPGIAGEVVKALERPTPAPVAGSTISVSTDDGFEWGDAGLGATATLALVLLIGAAGMLMIRHQRRRVAAY
jgi:hypothetical protein